MYQFVREPLDRYDDSNDDDYDFEPQDDDNSDSRSFSNKSNRLKRNSSSNPPIIEKRSCLSDLHNSDSSRLCFDEVLITTDQYPTEKLTRGKQKIPIQFIEDRTRRYSTFSKRKTGLMKKAFELAELTGAEVLLLVASETNHVYTFATDRLKNIIELDCGKDLIQSCLSSNKNSTINEQKKTSETSVNQETDCKYHDQTLHVETDGDKEEQITGGSNTNSQIFQKEYTNSQLSEATDKALTNSNFDSVTKSVTYACHETSELVVGDRCTQTEESSIVPVAEALPISGNLVDPIAITTTTMTTTSTVQPCKVPHDLVPTNPSQVILTGLFPPPSNVLLSTQMTTNQFLIVSPPWNPIPVPVRNTLASSPTCSTNSTSLGGVNIANLLNINTDQSVKSYSISIPLLNSVHMPSSTIPSIVSVTPTSIVNTESTTSLCNSNAFQGCILKKS